MAITQAGSIYSNFSNSVSSYVSSAVVLPQNALLLAAVFTYHTTPASLAHPTLTDSNGNTWVEIATKTSTNSSAQRRLTLFRTVTQNEDPCTLTVTGNGVVQSAIGLTVNWASGCSMESALGADAIAQVATASSGDTAVTTLSPGPALAAFGSTDNSAMAFFATTYVSGTSPKGGWTELNEIGPLSTHVESQFIATNDTTPNASTAGTGTMMGIAVELRASTKIVGIFQSGSGVVQGGSASPPRSGSYPNYSWELPGVVPITADRWSYLFVAAWGVIPLVTGLQTSWELVAAALKTGGTAPIGLAVYRHLATVTDSADIHITINGPTNATASYVTYQSFNVNHVDPSIGGGTGIVQHKIATNVVTSPAQVVFDSGVSDPRNTILAAWGINALGTPEVGYQSYSSTDGGLYNLLHVEKKYAGDTKPSYTPAAGGSGVVGWAAEFSFPASRGVETGTLAPLTCSATAERGPLPSTLLFNWKLDEDADSPTFADSNGAYTLAVDPDGSVGVRGLTEGGLPSRRSFPGFLGYPLSYPEAGNYGLTYGASGSSGSLANIKTALQGDFTLSGWADQGHGTRGGAVLGSSSDGNGDIVLEVLSAMVGVVPALIGKAITLQFTVLEDGEPVTFTSALPIVCAAAGTTGVTLLTVSAFGPGVVPGMLPDGSTEFLIDLGRPLIFPMGEQLAHATGSEGAHFQLRNLDVFGVSVGGVDRPVADAAPGLLVASLNVSWFDLDEAFALNLGAGAGLGPADITAPEGWTSLAAEQDSWGGWTVLYTKVPTVTDAAASVYAWTWTNGARHASVRITRLGNVASASAVIGTVVPSVANYGAVDTTALTSHTAIVPDEVLVTGLWSLPRLLWSGQAEDYGVGFDLVPGGFAADNPYNSLFAYSQLPVFGNEGHGPVGRIPWSATPWRNNIDLFVDGRFHNRSGGTSGTGASLDSRPTYDTVRVSGLTGMYPEAVGLHLNVTTSSNPTNNGSFEITAYIDDTTVDIWAGAGMVVPDYDNGDLHWNIADRDEFTLPEDWTPGPSAPTPPNTVLAWRVVLLPIAAPSPLAFNSIFQFGDNALNPRESGAQDAAQNSLHVGLSSDGRMVVEYDVGTTQTLSAESPVLFDTTPRFFELSRVGAVFKLYIDGVLGWTSGSMALYDGGGGVPKYYLGGANVPGRVLADADYFVGRLSNIRLNADVPNVVDLGEGAVAVALALAGSMSAEVPLAGALVSSLAMTGDVTTTAELAGALEMALEMTGGLSGVGELAGDLALELAMTGELVPIGELAGELVLALVMTGDLSATLGIGASTPPPLHPGGLLFLVDARTA